MKLLGALGLDWKILIIQAFNFLILFFILKELFFKPFIKALKEEKEKTERLKKMEEEISQEKENWQKEREKELAEARAKVEKIISEAENINRTDREKMKEEEIREEKETIERIRRQSQAILAEYRENLEKNYREKVEQSLLKIFDRTLSRETKIRIQDNFWQEFIKEIKKISLPETVEISLKEKIARDSKLKLAKGKKKQPKKIPVIISSAYPLKKYQENVILDIFEDKIPKKNFVLEKRIRESLIAGFRLEIGGRLVEENLEEKLKLIFH